MFRFTLLLIGFFWSPLCPAANFSISLSTNDTSVADLFYPSTASTVTSTFDKQSQITVTVAGRNYGTLPLPGMPRWGLKAEPLPWQPNKDGFVMTGGFQPSAAGSKVAVTGIDASYLTITLTNVQPNTRIQNLSIELQGLTQVDTQHAWGAASPGGFAAWSVPTINGGGNNLTLNLADFIWTAGGPLEIRLYGVTGTTGLSEGAFTDVKISGSLTVLIPEPETALLLAMGLALGLRFRNRRPAGTK